MSITGFSSDPKNSFHRRNNSYGELDVFEASKYFSHGHNPGKNFLSNRHYNNNNIPSRMSLDLPITRHIIAPSEFIQKEAKLDNKKHKQPSSPGWRLASFLNSLFNQTSLNKKKKSKPGKSINDENTPGVDSRRKRRTSTANTAESKNINNSNRSDFRTPPPPPNYTDTPTKSCKAISFFLASKSRNSRTTLHDVIIKGTEYADSDSSSDLFDLPNLELDFYSSGLPVYETTRMDMITIIAPI